MNLDYFCIILIRRRSKKRIKNIKKEYMLSYVYGELGIQIPYKKGDNLVHIWTVKALEIKCQ